MGSLEVIIILCFLFFIFFPDMITSKGEKCSSKTCHKGEPKIRFPFKLESVQLSNCGYPGFDLACSNQGKTVLQLPSSGMFYVEDIDYNSQKIRISDPDNCPLKRLLYLDLSSSPFKTVYNHSYIFLNCTNDISFESWKHFSISCLSRGDYYVLATSSMTPVGLFFDRSCEVIKTVLGPVQFLFGNGYLSFLQDDFQDITLSWDEPDCGYCEAQNQGCRLRNKTSHETICIPKRLTAGFISGICIGIVLPALLGIICYNACCIRGYSYDDENQPSDAELSNVTLSQPVIPMISLNDSTIDSYPKIVLGESRRLPNPDDNICPICLSEYLPKEILKIIPECNHNFHTDCIDKWLYTNMTCPVCRNSPT